jgi:serine/threonine-protein kinase
MLRPQDSGPATSMLPPMREDDGGFGYDERPARGRGGPEKKSNLSTILLAVAGILVLVGAIFIGKAIFGGDGKNSEMVPVPTLAGKTFKEAAAQGKNGDFEVKQVGSIFCDQAKGTVCKQDPQGGGEIKRYDTVELTMSKGKKPAEKIEVPDVLNVPFESAKASLEAKGFQVNKETEESDQTAGKVIRQSEDAGKKVARGTEITLTVAAPQQQVPVPDVTTKKLADAEATLKAQGFKVESTEQESGDAEAGTVINQDPAGGGTAAPGSTINLTVAKAPAQQEQVPVPNLGGQKLKDAKKALQDLGLNVGNIQGPQDDNATVVASNPGAGTQVPKGQSVNLITVKGNDDGGDNGGGFFGGLGG